ncbi:kelch-like protein 17 [Penaeus vannamei]|uniref:kelch-like protein 17 n=1 Tax=Penaeus vannamei TaxID=6689 RepID=UPI00387F3AF5
MRQRSPQRVNDHKYCTYTCPKDVPSRESLSPEGDLVEKTQEKVTLQELDSTALELLVEYSYTGEIVITEDNVQVLLPASSLLQMASVREACCKFLMRQLHPSNCLGIRSFADAHSCGELHTRSHRFALQNFPEVCGTEEFLLLPFKQVEELISSAQLNVPCEEKVFTAVISWVKHDLREREKHVPQLLQHVRLPLLSRDFLTSNVDAEPLVRENSACHHLLLEALKYHLLPEQRATLTSPRTQERQPEGVKPYLFACGGGSLFAIHSEVECYNPRTDRWMPVASMNYRRSRAGVTSLGRYLYVMGGYDGACDLSSAEMYNPGLNKWLNITAMGTKRSCLGIGTTDGLIYCVGGYDGASCLSSVERYDPLTGTWTSCPAMATRRRYCRVAVLGTSGAFGAVKGNSVVVLDRASYLQKAQDLLDDASTYAPLTSDPRERIADTFQRRLRELAACFPETNLYQRFKAVKGLTVVPGDGRVRVKEGLKGRKKGPTEEGDIRQGVPTSGDEPVKGRNDVNRGKGKRAENKGKTEAKKLKLVRGQGQGGKDTFKYETLDAAQELIGEHSSGRGLGFAPFSGAQNSASVTAVRLVGGQIVSDPVAVRECWALDFEQLYQVDPPTVNLDAGGERMVQGLHAVLAAIWLSGTVPSDLLRVKTDALDTAIVAVLTQAGCPVAFRASRVVMLLLK